MAFILCVLACVPRLRAAARGPSLMLLVLVVVAGLRPWVGGTALDRFWFDCARLRRGMEIDAALTALDDYWVQVAGNVSGCERLAIRDLPRAERWRFVIDMSQDAADSEQIIFYPFDGEECSADGCWASFEDGRLSTLWLSPD